MTSLTKDIALRLKVARIASGFKTSKEFAQQHAIALSTYCQHETGKRPLSIEQLFVYAELTKVEPSWLLTGKGKPCLKPENKQVEQKILQQLEKLSSSTEPHINVVPLIIDQERFSYVNMPIFKKIMVESAPLIKNIADGYVAEAIDFCFALYNRIITLDAKDEERTKMIKIGLKSFFDGLRIIDKEPQGTKHDRLAS